MEFSLKEKTFEISTLELKKPLPVPYIIALKRFVHTRIKEYYELFGTLPSGNVSFLFDYAGNLKAKFLPYTEINFPAVEYHISNKTVFEKKTVLFISEK